MNTVIKRLGVWAVVVASVLMIPLVSNAPWTGRDFALAGAVLYGAAVVYETIAHHVSTRIGRVATGIVVVLVVIVIWAWAVA